ncbi:CLUMA_CG004437, isoform A [Clunio marinus]|uniref:CLUMA_CG004437, isoform A n=1 Tax=Clunio marinus TaxID=568069 RepID=A0A1J1HX84_9DIPT|nr:CLUMA_CG004437, isoform A [Clunio marinus]
MEPSIIENQSDVVEIELKRTQIMQDVNDGPNRQQTMTNYYHSKKSAAEGMMDISLLTANANQLKFILFYNRDSQTFYGALSLISLSLILQIVVGLLLVFRRRFKTSGQKRQVSTLNEYLVLLIFLITVINVLAAVLTTTEHSA